ncbi:MAG TPA: hypothetical protein VK181_12540 [Rhizobium sp.]|nr:hypothetical protein [Rhizobium sp.]
MEVTPPSLPFRGLTIVPVDEGTEIEFEGRTLTVTDDISVVRNNTVYVTHSTFEGLKQELPNLPSLH